VRIPVTSPAVSLIALLALLAVGLGAAPASGTEPEAEKKPAQEGQPMVVEKGRTVSIEYTLKLDDGSTADSNVGGEPLRFVQGEGRILPSLENALDGLKVNDTKKVTLTAEQGYGPVDPNRTQTVPVAKIPEQARQVGATLVASNGQGQQIPVRVKEVKPDEIVLDLNHPLAGQTLHFDVKVLAIQ
jgi:FKBP-type peptidyl-prolyl cis-trans isomerase SlyD